MGKKDNVDIKIEYISLLKIIIIKKKTNFTFYPGKKKPKSMQMFFYLKNKFRHMSLQ